MERGGRKASSAGGNNPEASADLEPERGITRSGNPIGSLIWSEVYKRGFLATISKHQRPTNTTEREEKKGSGEKGSGIMSTARRRGGGSWGTALAKRSTRGSSSDREGETFLGGGSRLRKGSGTQKTFGGGGKEIFSRYENREHQ